MSERRTQIACSLAGIDQLLVEAEEIIEFPEDDLDGELHLLIEFQAMKDLWSRS